MAVLASQEHGSFDFITCTGVLHHLQQPSDGLRSPPTCPARPNPFTCPLHLPGLVLIATLVLFAACLVCLLITFFLWLSTCCCFVALRLAFFVPGSDACKRALKRVLRPGGGMSIMLYGLRGRQGIYDIQVGSRKSQNHKITIFYHFKSSSYSCYCVSGHHETHL